MGGQEDIMIKVQKQGLRRMDLGWKIQNTINSVWVHSDQWALPHVSSKSKMFIYLFSIVFFFLIK